MEELVDRKKRKSMAKEEKARLFLGAEHQMAVLGNGHADHEVAEVDSGSDEEIVPDILLIPLVFSSRFHFTNFDTHKSPSTTAKYQRFQKEFGSKHKRSGRRDKE